MSRYCSILDLKLTFIHKPAVLVVIVAVAVVAVLAVAVLEVLLVVVLAVEVLPRAVLLDAPLQVNARQAPWGRYGIQPCFHYCLKHYTTVSLPLDL